MLGGKNVPSEEEIPGVVGYNFSLRNLPKRK
jgi:hypothetical protein